MTDDSSATGAEHVYRALVEAGVEHLVGLPGTQTLALDRIVTERDEMAYVMARHETAIPHIAWGYYEASGRPAATLTVPGPGDTLAMHGLKNALEDSVPILHVSADVNPEDRGKGPIHEIAPDTFDNVVKANLSVERPLDLPAALVRGLGIALSPPYGPVRFGVPNGILEAAVDAPAAEVTPERTTYDTTRAHTRAVELLDAAERPVVYVGGGARRSPDGPRVVRELAEVLDAPVVASYKGKGVYPEDNPRFLGVTGSFLPAGARRVLERADAVLALGTDFDGVSTDHWSLPMGDALVHVTLDPSVVDVSYSAEAAILDDVTAAGDRLLADLDPSGGWDGARIAAEVRVEYLDQLGGLGLFDGGTPANSPELLTAVRGAVPREAVVAADVGGFRLWAMEVFEAYGRREFIAAGSWAGMGVGLPAAVGAAIAREEPVVCLTGDGGLMMCAQELHTAAEHDLDLVVVVSNNRDYGIISKSSRLPHDGTFAWTTPSFARIAEGFGCRAETVETAVDAADAVAAALDRGGPHLIDVGINPNEPSVVEAADYDSTVALPGAD